MDLTDKEVDIVAACVKDSVFTAELESKGIHFVELSGKLRNMKNHRLFRQLLKERKYDVVHFNLFQGLSLYYVQIAKEEGVAVRIAHSHGAGLRNSRTKPIKMLLHRIGRRIWASAATDHWACSGQAGAFLFARRQTSCTVIPNGIDTNRFRFSEEKRGEICAQLGIEDQILVGTVGRFSQEKNQTFLLDVFAAFLQREPNSRLLLVGEGEERPALLQKTQELGIADRVIFYGTTNAVEEVLAAMDVFVFPSLVEGLGIACVEAQASGLPVLCATSIPAEAKITPMVRSLDLAAGAQRWAQVLSEMPMEHSRGEGAAMVQRAGYDISDVAFLVSKKYGE